MKSRFETNENHTVTVWLPSGAIRVHNGAPFETDDPDLIEIMRQQPGIIETVLEEPKPKPKKREPKRGAAKK